MTQQETQYDKSYVQDLDALPIEEKTEDYGVDWDHDDLPGSPHYGDHPIVSVNWWFDLVNVWYDHSDDPEFGENIEPGDTVPRSWEHITFSSEVADDGTIQIVGRPPAGIISYEDAQQLDNPGANNIIPVYELLQELGMEIDMESHRQ